MNETNVCMRHNRLLRPNYVFRHDFKSDSLNVYFCKCCSMRSEYVLLTAIKQFTSAQFTFKLPISMIKRWSAAWWTVDSTTATRYSSEPRNRR